IGSHSRQLTILSRPREVKMVSRLPAHLGQFSAASFRSITSLVMVRLSISIVLSLIVVSRQGLGVFGVSYTVNPLFRLCRRGGVSPPWAGKPRPYKQIIEGVKYIIRIFKVAPWRKVPPGPGTSVGD